MKICFFINDMGIGGAQRVCNNLIQYFKSNCDVTLLQINPLSNNQMMHDNIISLNSKNRLSSYGNLLKFLKKNSFDIIFSFSAELGILVSKAKKKLKGNFVNINRCINTLSLEYANSSIKRRLFVRKYVKHFYKDVDCVVSQSQNMKEDLIKNFGVPEYKIHVINNPVDKKFNLDNSISKSIDILYVGRFEAQKNLNDLLDILNDEEMRKYKCVLVGQGSLESSIKKEIDEKKLNIEVHPFSNEIVNYYRKSKCFVLCSLYEGFPNTLLESIACGTPVVSYDCQSGPSEIIETTNGVLVKYLDKDALKKSIQYVLNKTWDNIVISESAKKYNYENIMNKYQELFKMVLNNSRKNKGE